jgi:hypothetical protein
LRFCGRSTTAFELLKGDVPREPRIRCPEGKHSFDQDASMTDMWHASHADMNADWEAAVAGRLPMLLTGPGSTTDEWIHHMQPRLALPVIEVACVAGEQLRWTTPEP